MVLQCAVYLTCLRGLPIVRLKIVGIGVKHPDIGELMATDSIRGIPEEFASPLDAQEVCFRIHDRLLDEERSLPRSDLKLETALRVVEPGPWIEAAILLRWQLIGSQSVLARLEISST